MVDQMSVLIAFLVGVIAGGMLATWVVLAVALAQHAPKTEPPAHLVPPEYRA
jgi:hypothetical protein